ncbi:MAG: hypothetical protein UR26_C0002G0125 [candidate division TM6 bacterium GW2011_GWF2_32_72]|nr:MAG: hypothetical protein UR26_C0002G0125 [candidate division TM6 bacterium GW2011_GWF2_32_72]
MKRFVLGLFLISVFFTELSASSSVIKKEDLDKKLFEAAGLGKNKEVQNLLKKGANIEASLVGGAKPLHQAVTNLQKSTIELLLKNGAKLDSLDDGGQTALHKLLAINPTHACAFLEAQCAKKTELQKEDVTDKLILEISKYLLQQAQIKGINLFSIKDVQGRTPLHIAARNRSAKIVELFIDAVVNDIDLNGKTALHYSAENKDAKNVIFLLIQKGGDIKLRDKEGRLPAHIFARSGDFINNLDALKLLIKDMSKKELIDNDGFGLVHFAVLSRSGVADRLKQLLKLGFDLNLQDKRGNNLLHYAYMSMNPDELNNLYGFILDVFQEEHVAESSGSFARKIFNTKNQLGLTPFPHILLMYFLKGRNLADLAGQKSFKLIVKFEDNPKDNIVVLDKIIQNPQSYAMNFISTKNYLEMAESKPEKIAKAASATKLLYMQLLLEATNYKPFAQTAEAGTQAQRVGLEKGTQTDVKEQKTSATGESLIVLQQEQGTQTAKKSIVDMQTQTNVVKKHELEVGVKPQGKDVDVQVKLVGKETEVQTEDLTIMRLRDVLDKLKVQLVLLKKQLGS